MKKLVSKLAFVAIAALIAMPQTAEAQGIGRLLKKAKKAADTVVEVTGGKKGTTVTPAVSTVPTVAVPGGGTISNPLSAVVDIMPVGLYGVSESENFGHAYLVLKVKLKVNQSYINFGCVGNQKALAVDDAGNTYNMYSSGYTRFDAVEGIPVTIRIDSPQMVFQNVKKSATVMRRVKLGVFVDMNHQGEITLSDMPIQWGVEPQTES